MDWTNPLTEKRCRPCEGGVAPFKDEEIRIGLSLVPGWALAGGKIERKFGFRYYDQTLEFVNAVADLAKQEDHHPEISFGYKACTVRYWTHAIVGLSENDFICAAKVNQMPGPV